MESKRLGINKLFADIFQLLENTVEPIVPALMNSLLNFVTEVLFNKKLEELKKLLENLKKLENTLTSKSFGMIWEKDLRKVRVYKQLVSEFIKKLKDELSEEEETVLKKIAESGWYGIFNRDLFVAFRSSQFSLEQVIEKLIDKEMLYRRESYLIISPRGKKYLAEKTGG